MGVGGAGRGRASHMTSGPQRQLHLAVSEHAAVALPITAVASVYGMNTIMNSGTRPVQLVVSLVAMGLLTVVMLIWARRQGWW